MRPTIVCALVTTAIVVIGFPVAPRGATPEPPLKMTAFAVNMSNIGTGTSNVVDIEVDRWSTDAERGQLVSAFNEKGPDALLSALEKTKRVGFMRLPNSLGYDLHFARRHPLEDGGEQVIIATDRRIGFWEARNQPRTIDYPFTLIEIRIRPNGQGEGKMALATKIAYNKKKNAIELENYSSEPVRLQNVRVEVKK